HVVLLAEDGAQIRGVGEFVASEPSTNTAELALVVEDKFQNRGIGQMLYTRLVELARERGISAFVGDIQREHYRVLGMMRRDHLMARLEPGLATVRFRLAVEHS